MKEQKKTSVNSYDFARACLEGSDWSFVLSPFWERTAEVDDIGEKGGKSKMARFTADRRERGIEGMDVLSLRKGGKKKTWPETDILSKDPLVSRKKRKYHLFQQGGKRNRRER